MALLPQFATVLWAFLGLSVVAMCFLAYGSYSIIEDGNPDWQMTTLMTLGQLSAMGFMVCSLVLLGHPTSALEVWRTFGVLIVAFGFLVSVISIRRSFSGSLLDRELRPANERLIYEESSFRPSLKSTTTQIAANILATVLASYFAVVSFWVSALPYIGQ